MQSVVHLQMDSFTSTFTRQTANLGVIGLMMAFSASAATVTFLTDTSSRVDGTTLLTMSNASGAAAILGFVPDHSNTVDLANANYVNWTLLCLPCTTTAGEIQSSHNVFIFNMNVTDTSGTVADQFVGIALAGLKDSRTKRA